MVMTKSERSELGQLIRKREKVMKSIAHERSTQMMAEFDRQSAQIYQFDDDSIWKAATEAAQKAVADAQKVIDARCAEMGIPPEFAPGINMGWYGRGQNAVASRRVELRRMVKSKVEATETEAITKIERLSLEAQTEVIAHGMESDAARAFLGNLTSIDSLMPSPNILEIKILLDAKHKENPPL